jgi:prepilin-type processing-associated H-X9-DG protein
MENYYQALDGPEFQVTNPWLQPDAWPTITRNFAIPAFSCPSDGLGGGIFNGATEPNVRLGKSNYLGIFSGISDGNAESDNIPGQRGVFRYHLGRSIAEIKDGTSNTMAVAEYLTGTSSQDIRGWFYTNRAACQTLFVTNGPNSPVPDLTIFCKAPAYSTTPDEPSMNLPCIAGGSTSDFASPRSRHPGGVNAGFCDGSVHFIQDGISLTAWQSLGWIDDGRAIATDF